MVLCFISLSLRAENLIIGTSSFNPPMESLASENGVYTGFEIDLVNEICHRINATCVYKPLPFTGVMQQVAQGKIDLGIDGFFITDERRKYFLFSQPYLQTKAQLFTTVDSDISASNINTGKRIGVEAGTVYQYILSTIYNNIEIVEYDNQPDMLEDLANHEIDLIMFDLIGASYWANTNSKIYRLVGDAIPFGNGYGIMANKNNVELVTRINKALLEMENDGAYLAIYSRYF